PIEVLKYFLMLNPRRARKLFLESIPQYTDEYLDTLRAWSTAEECARRNSPLEFVLQSQSARRFNSTLSFGLVMNLVSALGSGERELIWRYLAHYDPGIEVDSDTAKMTRDLMECALNYYRDFIEPSKRPYDPNEAEREQLRALSEWLANNGEAGAEDIEHAIYELGRRHYDKPGKIFPLLYRVILGQERGPRLGAFIRLTTPARVAEIVDARLG